VSVIWLQSVGRPFRAKSPGLVHENVVEWPQDLANAARRANGPDYGAYGLCSQFTPMLGRHTAGASTALGGRGTRIFESKENPRPVGLGVRIVLAENTEEQHCE